MYYYYVYSSQRVAYQRLDRWITDPYETFKGRRWFHIDDETGKVDMNINMANKTRRKLNRRIGAEKR